MSSNLIFKLDKEATNHYTSDSSNTYLFKSIGKSNSSLFSFIYFGSAVFDSTSTNIISEKLLKVSEGENKIRLGYQGLLNPHITYIYIPQLDYYLNFRNENGIFTADLTELVEKTMEYYSLCAKLKFCHFKVAQDGVLKESMQDELRIIDFDPFIDTPVAQVITGPINSSDDVVYISDENVHIV